jgi:hypothetical protein
MIDTNLLWSRAINPINGRIHKEPTILGCALIVIGLIALGYVVLVLFAFI